MSRLQRERTLVVRSPWLRAASALTLCWLLAFICPITASAEPELSSVEATTFEAEADSDPIVAGPPEHEAESRADAAPTDDSAGAESEGEAAAQLEDSAGAGAPGADPEAAADPGVEVADESDDPFLGLDGDAYLDLAGDGDEAIVFQEIPSVYGVSKFEQKITEAPSFVTLITSDEIAKYGYRTLAEVLQSATGFFVTYDRNYNYLGIRGFNRPGDFNTRVLLLVDGHRLNDNLYDQAGLGTESVVDVDLIDRVEVIRGPSSSLYGTNAFFGVINVITKRGRDVRGTEISGEVGSFDTYRARGTYGDKFSNGLEMLLSGSYYRSAGQKYLYYEDFDDPLTNNGVTTNADEDMFPSVFGKLSYRGATLQGGFVSREKGIPTAAYDTYFPTDRTRSTDEHAYLFLKYEHQFDSQMNLSGRVFYDRFYYQGDYLYDFDENPADPNLRINQDRSTGEWWGFETKIDRRFFDSNNVTAGIEYRDNFRQDLWNADLGPKDVLLDDERSSRNVAVFLQNEVSLLPSLIMNAGVRYDYYDSFGSTVNPRIAMIYNLEKTTFKALYGTAFRGPNAYERFYVGTGFIANPDLDPEKIRTYELVLEHQLTPYIRATMAGYFYRIEDLVSQEAVGLDLQFQNRGEIEAKGLELQLEMDHRGPLGIAGRLGYALQEAKDRDTNQRLTNSPAHLLNLNLNAPVYRDNIFAGFELLYASERKTLAGDYTDHAVLGNFTLMSRNLVNGLEVSTSVRNLFNRDYSDPGSGEQKQDQILQDGRTFWLKVKYGF